MNSLVSGCRTEEVRPLRWDHVVLLSEEELNQRSEAEAHRPKGHIKVWRSVRATGDTQNPRSRRSVEHQPVFGREAGDVGIRGGDVAVVAAEQSQPATRVVGDGAVG
jgi:hypothetical protein